MQVHKYHGAALMGDTVQTNIRKALSHSQRLLFLAKQGEWSEFEHCYRQRGEFLRKIDRQVGDTVALTPEQERSLVADLEELKSLNNQVLQLAEAHKSVLGHEAAEYHRTQKAMNAYKD
jgi:hypothetical protein